MPLHDIHSLLNARLGLTSRYDLIWLCLPFLALSASSSLRMQTSFATIQHTFCADVCGFVSRSIRPQVAHEFADLHDRSGRMKAKGVVRDILEWKTSRSYFYWRVKRRLAENGVRKMFKKADASMTYDDTTKLMQVWMGVLDAHRYMWSRPVCVCSSALGCRCGGGGGRRVVGAGTRDAVLPASVVRVRVRLAKGLLLPES